MDNSILKEIVPNYPYASRAELLRGLVKCAEIIEELQNKVAIESTKIDTKGFKGNFREEYLRRCSTEGEDFLYLDWYKELNSNNSIKFGIREGSVPFMFLNNRGFLPTKFYKNYIVETSYSPTPLSVSITPRRQGYIVEVKYDNT